MGMPMKLYQLDSLGISALDQNRGSNVTYI
jgi:hypothetical protein